MASLTSNCLGWWIYYSIAAGPIHIVNWKQLKLVIAGNKLLSAYKNLVLLGNVLTPEVSQTAKAVKQKPGTFPIYRKWNKKETVPIQADRVKGVGLGWNAASNYI